ncbi:hypothetical protein BRC93_16135 [Halobacteriales archaeon QS_5_70_15]|nr:MAG: hypothetical protein BRC93_16135 [Halobacteriales archaeon QS_5_70_15]
MVTVADVIGLLVILLVNGGTTALLTRFFRVRLDTRWGPVVYVLLIVPVVLVLLVLVLSGLLGLGPDLGSAGLVVGLTVVLPMAVGLAFDYFWMPAPDDVDLPAEYRAGD